MVSWCITAMMDPTMAGRFELWSRFVDPGRFVMILRVRIGRRGVAGVLYDCSSLGSSEGAIVIVVVGCRLSSPVFSFSFISNKKREFEIKSAVILNFNRNFEVEFVFEESESKIIFKINSGKKNRNLESEIFLK